MTEQSSEGNVGVNLGGLGDMDMWTGPTRAVGHAVVGVAQNLSGTIPGVLAKITASHRAISANITTWDDVSATYMEQENEGLPEFVDQANRFPGRIGGDAASCFKSVDQYLASDAEMTRRMRDVSGSPTGPEQKA